MPAELLRDQRRLIDSCGTRAIGIQFLQANKVGVHARDHFRDAGLGAAAIDADTAVHIVGRDAQRLVHRYNCGRKIMPSRPRTFSFSGRCRQSSSVISRERLLSSSKMRM